MGRVIALDVGSKTIGVAITDESESMAFPGQTILRQQGWRGDMAALRQLVADTGARTIVVGLPLMMNGTRGIQAEKIDAFVARLRNSVRIPIVLQDERLSTGEAERALRAGGRPRGEWKRDVDSMAACLILQGYLARRRTPLIPAADDLADDLEEDELS